MKNPFSSCWPGEFKRLLKQHGLLLLLLVASQKLKVVSIGEDTIVFGHEIWRSKLVLLPED